MTAVVVLSAVAIVAVCAAVIAVLRLRALTNERFATALQRIDDHLGALVEHVRRSMESTSPAAAKEPMELEPSQDLDRLLADIAREASLRCGADASAVEVEGSDGEPRRAYSGETGDKGLIHATLRALESRPFEAVSIDWPQSPTSGIARRLASALVVPIPGDGATIGAIGVFAFSPNAFRLDEARLLQGLAEDAARLVSEAQRLARIEQRMTVDDATGVRNRRGYLEELDREVARSRRTGHPASLVIVEVESESTSAGEQHDERGKLWELACVMTEVTRATDVVSRTHEREFAFLLPETSSSGAGFFLARLRSELSSHTFALGSTGLVAAGIAEWQSGESGDSLDRRARAALTILEGDPSQPGRAAVPEVAEQSPPAHRHVRVGSQVDLTDRLGRELDRIPERTASLALILHWRSGDLGAQGGEARRAEVLGRLVNRLDGHVPGSAGTYLTEASELAVVFPGLAADRAASALSEFGSSLRERPLVGGHQPGLFAGVTEIVAGDDADVIVGRARQALWQARQAGAGTVVVARAGGGAS